MTPRERIAAALSGAPIDRVPFALWRHFYPAENEGAPTLARATVKWTRENELDLIKHNPRAHYHAEPWGTEYAYHGAERPTLVRHAVTGSEDWARIDRRGAGEPAFRELLDGLRLMREALPDIPLVATIFTPLGVLERLAGRERVERDVSEAPERLLGALANVAATFRGLAHECLRHADGIFLATTSWARRDLLGDEQYARFGEPFDREVLRGAEGAPLNVLHVCGANARVIELARYPVAAVSWNPRLEGTPSLGEFRAQVRDRAAIGGLSDDALLSLDVRDVAREVAEGRAQTRDRRWIAAGGCTIPTDAKPAAIAAARRALAS